MKKILLVISLILLGYGSIFAQFTMSQVTNFNANTLTGPDTLRPWMTDKGVRNIWVDDVDKDGKTDFILTDYTNGGRVHVLELTPPNTLQLVWSSPRKLHGNSNSGSTPRWVRTGDLDGDGSKEIIFPLSNGTADLEVEVFECVGNNDYGTDAALILPAAQFSSQGIGSFRTNREVANVDDFDGDGKSELIMSNRDHSVYILGVLGSFPGFANWQVEGGDPVVAPFNSKRFSLSHWHSILVDFSGTGKKTIVNHHWNFWGFWGIKPRGADSYQYPDSVSKYYYEFFKNVNQDMVSYMGIQKVDVNGDKRDEIAGILYGGTGNYAYALGLISMNASDTGRHIWDSTKGGMLASNLWKNVGVNSGSFWGIGAADLNGNGRQEILLGGTNDYTLTSVEYKGTGGLLDSASYTTTAIYKGEPPYDIWNSLTINDSLGIKKDTIRTESPFVSRMLAGFDSDGDKKPEVALAYQSVYDSITVKYYHWRTDSLKYVLDSTKKFLNPKQINFRLLESSITGIEARDLNIVTPDDFTLEQNYPNPFNPSTTIRFALPVDENISVKIYDVLGNLVTTLVNSDMKRGSYEVSWDGTNNLGIQVASGNYIAEMKFGNFTKSIKMQLLK